MMTDNGCSLHPPRRVVYIPVLPLDKVLVDLIAIDPLPDLLPAAKTVSVSVNVT